jgi:hypothetical protein
MWQKIRHNYLMAKFFLKYGTKVQKSIRSGVQFEATWTLACLWPIEKPNEIQMPIAKYPKPNSHQMFHLLPFQVVTIGSTMNFFFGGLLGLS